MFSGKIKFIAVLLLAAVCAFVFTGAYASLTKHNLKLYADADVFPANGISTATIRLHKPRFFLSDKIELKIMSGRHIVHVLERTGSSLTLQSRLIPGDVVIQAKNGASTNKITLHFIEDFTDDDADGFPDVAELTDEQDRLAFRRRFVAAAISQYEKYSPQWEEKNRDCAGLVRFALQEALKKNELSSIPGVQKYHYPYVPVLGKRIFRVRPGAFNEKELPSAFSFYADSRKLMENNTHYIGKDAAEAQEGDLLFFLHYDDLKMPYHAMIYAGNDKNGVAHVVYHTGPVHGTKGKVKLLTMQTLMHYPDERWHPVPENKYFLGVYRLNILD